MTSKVHYFLRSNSSVYSGQGKARGIFLKCGDPAQKEIFGLFKRGQDFELVSYFDKLSAGPVGVLNNCRLLRKAYTLDGNRCYDLVFEWECDFQCGQFGECAVPNSDYVLGAWTRNPPGDGGISGREPIATFLLGFSSAVKTSSGSCGCPIGGCSVEVGMNWAGAPVIWFEPKEVIVVKKMQSNCNWSDLPNESHTQVGPGNPGNARPW